MLHQSNKNENAWNWPSGKYQRSTISINDRQKPGTSGSFIAPRKTLRMALENSPGLEDGKKQTHIQQTALANIEKGFFKMLKFVFPQHIVWLDPSSPFFECQFEKLKAITWE